MTGGTLKLTEELRRELKKPFGRVISNIEELKSHSKILICVGDRTSEIVLSSGILPKICVYDKKVMRKEIEIPEAIKNFDAEEICIKNPTGCLNLEVFKAIKEAIQSEFRYKIYIEGEEDLVALAAIDIAPIGSLVTYGQPGLGMVIVDVNQETKEKVRDILNRMKI